MADRSWKLALDDKTYTVQIVHAYLSGRREIHVDGQLAAEASGMNAGGMSYEFAIGPHAGKLRILTNGLTYRYVLFVDNVPVAANEDPPKDKLIQSAIDENAYWSEVARLSGLRYLPVPGARGFWQHRLVGAINGYLVTVRLGLRQQGSKLVLGTTVRYSPVLNLEAFKLQVSSSPAFAAVSGQLSGDEVEFAESHGWVALTYDPIKEPAEIAAKKMQDLVGVISQYARPLRPDACDSQTCKHRAGLPLKVVFLNEFPLLLCQDCIDDIPGRGKQAKEEYKQAPSGLVKGLLAGTGAAISAGLVWAILTILFDRAAAIFGAAIIIGIVKTMDRVGTKRTGASILFAAVLAIGGVFLGAYLTMLWVVSGESAMPAPSLQAILFELKIAWEIMWATPGFMRVSLSFCLFGVVPYLIMVWMEQDRPFSRVLRPQVEVAGDTWF